MACEGVALRVILYLNYINMKKFFVLVLLKMSKKKWKQQQQLMNVRAKKNLVRKIKHFAKVVLRTADRVFELNVDVEKYFKH